MATKLICGSCKQPITMGEEYGYVRTLEGAEPVHEGCMLGPHRTLRVCEDPPEVVVSIPEVGEWVLLPSLWRPLVLARVCAIEWDGVVTDALDSEYSDVPIFNAARFPFSSIERLVAG